MTIRFSKARRRALVLPSLAAALLAVGIIGIAAARADGHGRLTADEMEFSRGGDLGSSITSGHCDVGNKKRVADCGQTRGNIGDVCKTCSGGSFKTVGPDAGKFVAGVGEHPCGKSVTGVCQGRFRKRKLFRVVCTIPVGANKGAGCIPGPSVPLPQTIVVAGPGPGS